MAKCAQCDAQKVEIAALKHAIDVLQTRLRRLEATERDLHKENMPPNGSMEPIGDHQPTNPTTLVQTPSQRNCAISTEPPASSSSDSSSDAATGRSSSLVKEEDCAVCLCPMERVGKALFRTTCGHVFHFQCVKECVLTSQNGCPLCRKSFSEMTPPRTPLTERNANKVFPGFMSANAFLSQQQSQTASGMARQNTRASTSASTPISTRPVQSRLVFETPERAQVHQQTPSLVTPTRPQHELLSPTPSTSSRTSSDSGVAAAIRLAELQLADDDREPPEVLQERRRLEF